jgi:hypothetical protein
MTRSKSSSVYSPTSPNETRGSDYKVPLHIIQSYAFPERRHDGEYKVINPYSHSLWYDSRGEIGNGTINEIKERVSKRKIDETLMRPPRMESLSKKKVDSPINNKHFFVEPKGGVLVCDSPVSKPPGLNLPETRYRKAFEDLITTESKYLNDLKLINTVYRDILHTRKYRHILSKDQEAAIFSNLEAVMELSQLLLNDITKEAKKEFEGKLEINLKEHFDFIKIENINIGDMLQNQFIRLKFVYASYYKNYNSQISTLKISEQQGGPKVSKWLDECSFLAKSRSDCEDLQSLLVTPIQRLSNYMLLINNLLQSSDDDMDYKLIEDLYDAKTELEKLLDTINNNKDTIDDEADLYETVDSDHNVSRTLPKKYSLDRADYISKVQSFRTLYTGLSTLKDEVELSLDPLLKFILYQKRLSTAWKCFMEHDDSTLEKHFISSIYSAYLDKVDYQEHTTRLIITEIGERAVHAIELALENCSVVKAKINKHNSNRGAYANYMKNKELFYTRGTSNAAQEYITIENEIRDELPIVLKTLEKCIHYIILLYNSLILKWLRLLGGESQLEQYQAFLKSKDLTIGDNFDIIEMFSYSRNNTKEAMKDICAKSPELSSIFSVNPYNTADFKISASKVVRKLFGI